MTTDDARMLVAEEDNVLRPSRSVSCRLCLTCHSRKHGRNRADLLQFAPSLQVLWATRQLRGSAARENIGSTLHPCPIPCPPAQLESESTPLSKPRRRRQARRHGRRCLLANIIKV